MPKFTDNQGREWSVYIDIPIARKIRKQLDVNILDIAKALPELAADPILLCDVLFLACQDQASQKGVTDEEFGRSLVGDAIGQASEALVDALINFSPPRQREMLQNLKMISMKLQDQQTGMVQQTIDRMLSGAPGS